MLPTAESYTGSGETSRRLQKEPPVCVCVLGLDHRIIPAWFPNSALTDGHAHSWDVDSYIQHNGCLLCSQLTAVPLHWSFCSSELIVTIHSNNYHQTVITGEGTLNTAFQTGIKPKRGTAADRIVSPRSDSPARTTLQPGHPAGFSLLIHSGFSRTPHFPTATLIGLGSRL